MREFFNKFFNWLRSTYSEPDGAGSSSRVLTGFLATISAGVVVWVTHHITGIKDVAILTAWLSSFPIIISSLVLLFTAPYGVNKGSGSISDIIGAFKKKDQ